ncbi:hypothetical protein HPG69_015427, partial [Diceros bicornis minor]
GLVSNKSSQILGIIRMRPRPLSTTWPTCIYEPPTSNSLLASILIATYGPKGCVPLLAFFEDKQKLSQDESGYVLDALEGFMVLEKNLNVALLDLHPLGSASTALMYATS